MHTKIVLAVFMTATSLITACGPSETPSQTPGPAATPAPATPPAATTGLKQIQQQRTGDYVVAVLNDTGDLKQGTNNLTLEFRKATDNQLADVGNVQVQSTMEMKGMSPMMAKTNVTPSGTPGRYNMTADLSMAGAWKTVVTFGGNQKVQFDLGAK
jgi:hypothetical protein